MSVDVNDESGFQAAIDLAELSSLADYVLSQLRVHPLAELNILLVDEETSASLHVQWMDLEGPTDVLSFPMDELRPTPIGEEPREGILGDIVICPQVALKQARSSGHSVVDEVLLLATHGILHLLGYDHEEPEERAEMFELQRELLLTFLSKRDPSREVHVPEPTVD
ncbi:MAG: rRNA maturation RNase YbeY [Actinomycetaceae bacterium]|nr:rRNA maturation RNase YbeY [Actinomycetaceae bacterium]